MNVAEKIIKRFGGTRKMASDIGLPPSTIQSWKSSGVIPARRQQWLISEAGRLGISLQPVDFFEQSQGGEPQPDTEAA